MISIILVLTILLYFGLLSNALNILAVVGIVSAVSMKYKNLFTRSYIFYIVGIAIAVISLIFKDTGYFDLVNFGIIGYGFLILVMFVGVLPNKWGYTRVIKKNRGVYSILAFILITPHAAGHVFGLFGGINLFGIAAYVIMVPLTIISFRTIRREIDPKDWFTIQKAAYGVYLILFVHLFMVATWENRIVYAVLVTLYINNKLLKEIRK